MLELTEQERVGRLVERLENMKRNALGNGTNQCVLCGDSFGMLGAPSLLCHDCKKDFQAVLGSGSSGQVAHRGGTELYSSNDETTAPGFCEDYSCIFLKCCILNNSSVN
ncbi:Rabphilin-3A [Gryllus bimaculatus]|nr:Rabphilin-3A [Gryllus bimaculatus]